MDPSCKDYSQFKPPDVCVAVMLALNQMRLAGQLCDLHLAVENMVLMAHKAVLSAACGFFKAAIDQENAKETAVYRIDGVQTDVMMQLLDFLYTGKLELSDSTIGHFKALADQLQIPLLDAVCMTFQSSRSHTGVHTEELVTAVKPDPVQYLPSGSGSAVVLTKDDHSLVNLNSEMKVEEVTEVVFEDSAGLTAEEITNQLMEVATESDAEAVEVTIESEVEMETTEQPEANTESVENIQDLQTCVVNPLDLLGFAVSTAVSNVISDTVVDNGTDVNVMRLTKSLSKPKRPRQSAGVNAGERVRRKRQPKIKEDMLQCPWCTSKYSSQNALREHAKTLHLTQMIKCEYCPRVFVHRDFADNHMDRCCFTSQVDRPDGRYRCPCCKYNVAKLQQAVAHYRKKHTNKTSNTCVHCGETFQDIDNFHEHLLVVHNADLSNIRRVIHKCPFCEFKTVKRYNFQQHQLTHTREKFKCVVCFKEFKTKMSLQVHMKHLHRKPEKFSCSECGFHTQYRAHLKMHLYRLHGVITEDDQVMYTCHFCDYTNMRRSYVEKHELQCHGEVELIKCASCPKTFKTKLRLQVHERIHTNSFPFKCDLCNFQTRSKENLNAHRKTKHFNYHPYKCQHCGKRIKYSISRHRKRCLKALSRQNEEIQYKSKKIQMCELCGMVLRSSFNRHRIRCLKALAKKKSAEEEKKAVEIKIETKENDIPGVCEHCGLSVNMSLHDHQKYCQKVVGGMDIKLRSDKEDSALVEPGRKAYMQHVCNYCGEAIKGSMRRHQKQCEKALSQATR